MKETRCVAFIIAMERKDVIWLKMLNIECILRNELVDRRGQIYGF